MSGKVVLCGGNEFQPASMSVSKALLAQMGRTYVRLVIVPIANVENPRRAVQDGVGHFSDLHIHAEVIMITDAKMANEIVLSAPIETANAIYFTDGIPPNVVDGLADTAFLTRLLHFWNAGLIVAASGASAMAFCDWYWDGGRWEKGLGLLKGIVVLPHYEYVAGRFSTAQLYRDLPPEYTILGLDDSTGVVIDGEQVQVIGAETVTVCRADSESEYSVGDSFRLDRSIL